MAKRAFSIRLDEAAVKELRRRLKAASNSDAVQRAIERINEEERELEKMTRYLRRWGGKGGPDAFSDIDPRRT